MEIGRVTGSMTPLRTSEIAEVVVALETIQMREFIQHFVVSRLFDSQSYILASRRFSRRPSFVVPMSASTSRPM